MSDVTEVKLRTGKPLQIRAWRLFDDTLVSPLDTTFSLAHMHNMSSAITKYLQGGVCENGSMSDKSTKYLHFYVSRRGEVVLDEYIFIVENRLPWCLR